MPPTPPTFVDLFSGLGGFHVGLRRLGYECVLACEKDAALRDLYKVNFGLMPAADIRRLTDSEIPPHTILCAGFPCQPFSKAGEQLGLSCSRDGDLFSYIIRILKYHLPPIIILENVPNLLRHNSGSTYSWMASQLTKLGYEVAHTILSPHNFGIPQIRARAFIVGSLGSLGGFTWPQPTFVEPDIRSILDKQPRDAKPLSAHYRECIDIWQDFLDRIPANAPLPSFPIWAAEFNATYPIEGLPPAQRNARSLSRYRGSFGRSLKTLPFNAQLAQLPPYARSPQPFPAWKSSFISQNRRFFTEHHDRLSSWVPRIEALMPSLQKLEWNCRDGVRSMDSHILQFRASGLRVKRANWAPAIIAMTTTQVPVIPWEERYISVNECARLQGLGSLDLGPLSESRAYRAIGNAVSADLVQLVARSLSDHVGASQADSAAS